MFVRYGLYDKALMAMYYYHYDMEINLDDLMKSLEALEWRTNLVVSGDEIKKLILYCEDCSDVSIRLGLIECKYIELFEYDTECNLSSLNNLLYDNLSLFFECVCCAYKAESEKNKPISLTSEEKKLAKKAHSILYKWIKLESRIESDDAFGKWFDCVIWHAKRVDRLNIVLEILGSKLFHVKSNEVCGFLSKAVVKILENPNAEFLHRGYTIEAFNSRGYIGTLKMMIQCAMMTILKSSYFYLRMATTILQICIKKSQKTYGEIMVFDLCREFC